MSNQSKPLMVVLSSPSGAGKTTLSKKIQQSDNFFKISVSHTTRKPRANEVDGVDTILLVRKNLNLYWMRMHFTNIQKFLKIIMVLLNLQ